MTFKSYHSPSFSQQPALSPLLRVNRKSPCPVCHKPDNCATSTDGRIAYCRRVRGDRQGRDGGWTHYLTHDPPHTFAAPPKPSPKPVERADADHIDAVLTTLNRKCLVLSEQHKVALIKRGLAVADIEHAGYRSMPTSDYSDTVARALEAFDLRGVPGFYRDGGRWRMNVYGAGILIPVRDPHLRVCGLQVRLDEGATRYLWLSSASKPEGASPGTPTHFSRPHRIRETGEALITEGALKADVISAFLNCAVVAVPGVSVFNEGFGERLKSELPELRRVVIAFDSDWRTKPQVRAALEKLMKVLSRAGIRWSARTWTGDAKGYDDYLLAASIEQEVAA